VNERAEARLMGLSTSAAAGVLLWISRTLLALLASYPLLLAVRASMMTGGPEGDAVLFQPGSLLLLELLRVGAPWLAAATELSLMLLGVAAILELIPLAVALDLLAAPNRPLRERAARALRLFPRFLVLSVLTLLVQAALLLAASLLGAALKPVLASADERLRSIAPLALMALGLVACGWFGGVLDIARATLVRRHVAEAGARAALARTVDCLRRRPLRVLFGVYPSVAGSALAALAAIWFLARFVPMQATGRALALGFVAHQLAILFAIAWRVRWLGEALELSIESD
jgi:hypothetical protein